MSRFIIGQIKADVKRLDLDLYSVRLTHPEDEGVWIESNVKQTHQRKYRTALSDLEIAAEAVSNLYAHLGEFGYVQMRAKGTSPEEARVLLEVAQRFSPYLEDAMVDAKKKSEIFLEHYEKGVGPLEMGIRRKLELPEHIGNKEEIAQFFAYLYLVDSTSFHPDEDFSTYEDLKGRPAYTHAQAEARNILMVEAFQAADAEGLDIYELAIWVGALTGSSDDPDNEASAPAWLKALSNTWA